jgi:hypothetical protein
MRDEAEETQGVGDAATRRKTRLHTEFFIAASARLRVPASAFIPHPLLLLCAPSVLSVPLW